MSAIRAPQNPTLPYAPNAPADGTVAAMAALQRALDSQTGATGAAGPTAGQQCQVALLGDPPRSQPQLFQGFFLGYRGRPAG
jgi:hypothetical protein